MDYWMDQWLDYHKKREEIIVINRQNVDEQESWIWKMSKYWQKFLH